MSEPLESLLAQMNAGNPRAVEALFVSLEPYMRMVIRRRIAGSARAKFDSADVVQSVWADFVDGVQRSKWQFETIEQLRAFLLKMARNRLIDRLRKHRESLRRDIAIHDDAADAIPPDRQPRVSEDFYAGELWQQMLAACPPEHIEILNLKRHGTSIEEIASRTNLHAGSVRRILYQIAGRVTRLQVRAVAQHDARR